MKLRTYLAPLAAVFAFIAAASCCLPIGVWILVVGFVGGAAVFESLRPYFIGLAVIFLMIAFWQTYGAFKCEARRNRVSVIMLWTATALVVLLFLFPQMIAGFFADWFLDVSK